MLLSSTKIWVGLLIVKLMIVICIRIKGSKHIYPHCQQLKCPHSSLPVFASGCLDFRFLYYFRLVQCCIVHACTWRTYTMSWAQIIWPKWQRLVGTLGLLAVWYLSRERKYLSNCYMTFSVPFKMNGGCGTIEYNIKYCWLSQIYRSQMNQN